MRCGETLIDIGSPHTIVVCPSGFKPSVTPITHLVFIGSFFGYSTQLKFSEGIARQPPLYILTHLMTEPSHLTTSVQEVFIKFLINSPNHPIIISSYP